MFALALPRKLSDAVTIISGCSLVVGSLTWAVTRIWMLLSKEQPDVERWVLDGLGFGAVVGMVVALIYLNL